MSIKAKQVAGVTTLVLVIVAVVSAIHLATLLRLSLSETHARAEILARAIFDRAKEVVANPRTSDPYEALRQDGAIRSTLQSTAYFRSVTYAAIVNTQGVAIANNIIQDEGKPVTDQRDLTKLVEASPWRQFSAVYSDQMFEFRLPMLAGDQDFGAIRVGVSPLLIRSDLEEGLTNIAGTIALALLVSSLVAMLLSQWMLRPIHVIQSGLTRLGRGELDVRLDLPEKEFGDLGSSFDAISAQLSAVGRAAGADATARNAGPTDLESVMDNLEDAMALFSPSGELMFRNTAMKPLLPGKIAELAPAHPIRQIVERSLAGRTSQGPVSMKTIPSAAARAATADGAATAELEEERLLISHAIQDPKGRFLGVMLVVRNLGYLSHIQSTLNYSRKLAALGRLMAGVAHEVKNPLNAMTIHLELLKQKLSRQPAVAAVGGGGSTPGRDGPPDVIKHVNVISSEIRRLDEVVIGFLKFARPDELKLQPVHLVSLVGDISTAIGPEAQQRGVTVKTECPETLPAINADPGMLRQALLNLALNACQAMPNGGTLKFACRPTSRGRVEIDVEDTGVGIPPEHLGRIFDLYFTTKEKGSGIGLSMVYRIVQLHDGEVEVQSTPGRGTRFRLMFPQA